MCSFFCLLRTSVARSTNTIVHGGRAYPVRHYPVAIRLRDREGRAILCVALTPQSGYSSGTTLGVRSVALLHARCSLYARARILKKLNTFLLQSSIVQS